MTFQNSIKPAALINMDILLAVFRSITIIQHYSELLATCTLMEKCELFVYHRMPGSTFKKCGSCNVHISVACKTCKHCGLKQEMKQATKAAKQKINDKWVKSMKNGNNFCKLTNAANVLVSHYIKCIHLLKLAFLWSMKHDELY